jgi:hypothetical protein
MPKKIYKLYKVNDTSDSLVIKKDKIFDLPFRIALIGSSGSGKTSLLVNLVLNPMYYGNDFEGDNIFIISGSMDMDEKIQSLVKVKDIPPAHLFKKFNEDKIQVLYDFIKDEVLTEMVPHKTIKRRLIIFDDVSFSGGLKDKEYGVISEMVCNCRKINVSLIFTSQKYTQLSTTIRSQLTGAVFFTMNDKELKLISDDFNYGDVKKFKTEFRKATQQIFDEKNKKFTNGIFIVNKSNPQSEWFLKNEFNDIIKMD